MAQELPRFNYLKFRLVPQENWHVTVKFLGEVPSSFLPLIDESVHKIAAQCKPFALTFSHIGFLNRRIFAFSLTRSPKLFALFKLIDERLASRGVCEPEHFRTFTTHITVGRKHPPIRENLHAVRYFELKARSPVSFMVESIDCMESTLLKEGSKYTHKKSYYLSR